MVKSVELPLQIYEDLVRVTEELSLMSKKPFSTAMAVNMLIEVYRAHMSDPCALDAFTVQLRSANFMTPQEYERYWDETEKPKTAKRKAKPKK